MDAALGELRAAGWPAPEDPGEADDAELDRRDLICDRRSASHHGRRHYSQRPVATAPQLKPIKTYTDVIGPADRAWSPREP